MVFDHDLDPLFLIPFPENVKIAAPMCYWLDNHGYVYDTKNCVGADDRIRPIGDSWSSDRWSFDHWTFDHWIFEPRRFTAWTFDRLEI